MSQTLTPGVPVTQNRQTSSATIQVEGLRRPMFQLCWHPSRGYDLIEGAFVPRLQEFPFMPGVQNVKADGSSMYALSMHARRGWILIPTDAASPDDTPDRQPGYVRVWPSRKGAHHEHAWVRYDGSHGRFVRRLDAEGYAVWRTSLVTRGILPAPDRTWYDHERDRLQTARDRFAGRADVNPYAASELVKVDEEIAVFEAAVVAATAPPKRTRSPKR